MNYLSAILILFLFPSIAFAFGVSKDFSFLWEKGEWVLSGVVIILLWVLLRMVTHLKKAHGRFNSVQSYPKRGLAKPVKREIVEPEPEEEFIEYIVARGDSLVRIAKRFDTTKEEIIKLNKFKAPFKMKLGQKIKVPISLNEEVVEEMVEEKKSTRVDDVHPKKEDEFAWLDDGKKQKKTFDHPDNKKLFSTLKVLLWFSGIVGLVVVVSSVWFYYDLMKYNNSTFIDTPDIAKEKITGGYVKPESEIISTPTEEEVEKAEEDTKAPSVTYPLVVLNGNGEAGAASELADLLEEEGFEVSKKGNADSYDYETTVVQYIATQEVWAQVLESWLDLKGYTITLEEVKDGDDTTVTIIIGAK